jgi:EmrB/QacA subfamily drug resistance transporter
MTADTPAAGPARITKPFNPWLPMSVVMAATIMVALDSTIVNIALHPIGDDLGAGAGIEWVVIAYLLAVCASQPATGWLADRFGRKRVFLTSLVAFTVASALCGLSPTLGLLIAARVLQGLGGGALMPVGMAMALELFPPDKRGRAMATWGMAAMAAPAIGPTVGGWLVTAVSWHWLFFINVPIGIVTLIAGLRLLPKGGTVELRPFDAPGLVLGGVGLAAVVLGVSEGSQWGWSAPATLLCLVGGSGLLAGFVVHELRRRDPLIELRMFSVSSFRYAIGSTMLVAVAQYARLVFIPLQLQALRGYSALEVGLLFMPAAVASAIGMQIGGRVVDRTGARRPVVIGCLGVAVSMLGLWQLELSAPIEVIAALMSLQGLSWGLTTSPGLVAGLGQVPKRLIAQATAVRSLAQQVAAAVSVAILSAVVTTRLTTGATTSESWDAYNTAYLVAFVASIAAALLAFGLPDRAEALHRSPESDEAAAEDTVIAILE